MSAQAHATKAFWISVSAASVIIVGLVKLDGSLPAWVPQVVVTLAGLVGISWFAGRRLDLFDKGIQQRQESATAQLRATERGNLNGAFREAVQMMATNSLSSILAGQSWLHKIADGDRKDTELARALLCSQVVSGTNPVKSSEGVSVHDPEVYERARQSGLNLLFRSPGNERYARCSDRADLSGANWRGVDFAGLDVSDSIFRNGDFTEAEIESAQFDKCDLRATKWAGTVGGNALTSMVDALLCGARASSCTFQNIDFTKADMSTDGPRTEFLHCIFLNCIFDNAKWTGARFVNARFHDCPTVTYELCHDAVWEGKPIGLPAKVEAELRRKGVSGFRPDD